MKKTLMLPLAAMVSGLLVGCGGGEAAVAAVAVVHHQQV